MVNKAPVRITTPKFVALSNPELILRLHKQQMSDPSFPMACVMANAAGTSHANVFLEIPVFKLLPKQVLLS